MPRRVSPAAGPGDVLSGRRYLDQVNLLVRANLVVMSEQVFGTENKQRSSIVIVDEKLGGLSVLKLRRILVAERRVHPGKGARHDTRDAGPVEGL